MKKILLSILLALCLSTTAFAYDGDISINGAEIRFSSTRFLEGNTVRIYATAQNHSGQDLLGIVRFFGNSRQIGGDQPISIFANKTDDIFVDWTPASYGQYKMEVILYPWNKDIDDPSNNSVSKTITVLQDTDHDGLPNSEDPDDDNDGVPDTEDHFPTNAGEQYDSDGDGKGDNSDEDDDNDGVPDTEDDLPLDPTDSKDSDGDGIGDSKDEDNDNDGISDEDEELFGTDPLDPDTDKDGTPDGEDAFPQNPDENTDTDHDNIGNNEDEDDDNDGIPDNEDDFPLNKGPEIKIKGDNKWINIFSEHTFDASPSEDEDGEIVSYSWVIDGEEREGNSISHVFTTPGDYDISLTVTDDQGESRTKDFQVSVLNLRFYIQITLIILLILLALLIYFKYIAEAENPPKKK